MNTEPNFNRYMQSEKALKNCLEYSDNPEMFTKVFKTTIITAYSTGIKKYFPEDKDNCQTLEITVFRELQYNGKKEISFTFGMSLHDTAILTARTKEIDKVLLELPYSLYTCMSSDFYIPDTFKDFCSEFGYDTDSRKAYDLYRKCLIQSNKLKTIFTEEEIDSFPR